MRYTDIEKMACISNINTMRQKIGLKPLNIDWLLKNRTYDQLYEEQNSIISHYNEAVKNSK